MSNNAKQYFIYLRSSNLRVECSEEQFKSYYKEVDSYRRTQMNHGQCICPRSKWLTCDMDCLTCKHHTSGKCYSLDNHHTDDEGNEMNWMDQLQEQLPDLRTPSIEENVLDRAEATDILDRLAEVMPMALEIGRLREQGLSDTAISKEIGVPRKTFTDRLKKLRDQMKNEFPEYF